MTVQSPKHAAVAVALCASVLAPGLANAGGPLAALRKAFRGPISAPSDIGTVEHIESGPDGLVAEYVTGGQHWLYNADALSVAHRMNRNAISSRSYPTSAVALQPRIRLGGWSGWFRGRWMPQIADAANTAGVALEMRAVEQSRLKGTTYQLVVSGHADAIARMNQWYLRRLKAEHDAGE